jgi:hypothetical protein
MANATLPLLSAKAQGSIADVLTFQERCGRHKVRFQRKQKDAHSDNQIPRRALVIQGNATWASMTQPQKDVYNARAVGLHMSGFNLYMSEFLKQTTAPDQRSIFGQGTYGYREYGRDSL